MRLKDHLPRECERRFKVHGVWRGCGVRSCSVECLFVWLHRKASALKLGVQKYRPDLRVAHFVRISLVEEHAEDWEIASYTRSRLKRILQDQSVEFFGCLDYGTSGFHFHLTVYENQEAPDDSGEDLRRLVLDGFERRPVLNPEIRIEGPDDQVAVQKYVVGIKKARKIWVIPKALSRKHLHFYSKGLFGPGLTLSELQRESRRLFREALEASGGMEPSQEERRKSDARLHATFRLMSASFGRSERLIQRLDGPAWRRGT